MTFWICPINNKNLHPLNRHLNSQWGCLADIWHIISPYWVQLIQPIVPETQAEPERIIFWEFGLETKKGIFFWETEPIKCIAGLEKQKLVFRERKKKGSRYIWVRSDNERVFEYFPGQIPVPSWGPFELYNKQFWCV